MLNAWDGARGADPGRGRRGAGRFRRAGFSRTWTQGSANRPRFASPDWLHPGLLNCMRPFRARGDGAEVE